MHTKLSIINLNQLCKIVDSSINSIYFSSFMKQQKKLFTFTKNEYTINIDIFLNNCKISDFKFANELKNESFIERLVTSTLSQLPNNLRTKDIKLLTNISYSHLKQLRNNNCIEYICLENSNYPKNSKGRIQYLYPKNPFLNYLKERNTYINKNIIIYSKQFYSSTEALEYLKSKNIKISLKTLYRYIYTYNLIPAIKIGGMIRIPILEFHNLHHNIFTKKYKIKGANY